MSEATRERFDIGRLLERLFGTLGRNFPVFFALALILTGLPAVLMGLASLQRQNGFPGAGPSSALFLAGTLIGMVSSFILQAAIVHGAVMDLNGRRPTLADCLTGGLRHFLPVLAISLLLGLAVVFGLLFLIVPGVVMLLIWAVVVPVQVVENRGVFAAFGRSADLTRHNRLSILALGVVWLIVAMVIGAVIGGLAVATAAGGAVRGVLVTQLVVSPLSNALSAVISSTGIATLYVELRRAKEGAAPEDLAAIFD